MHNPLTLPWMSIHFLIRTFFMHTAVAAHSPPVLRAAGLVGARAISTPADSHFIMSATGPDRAGIVFDLSKLILDNGGDIQQSAMMRMGCVLACMRWDEPLHPSPHPSLDPPPPLPRILQRRLHGHDVSPWLSVCV